MKKLVTTYAASQSYEIGYVLENATFNCITQYSYKTYKQT